MSVVFSGTNSGTFVSTGAPQLISLPSSVDWMIVKNLTTITAAGAGTGVEFYWQRGMPQGRGIIYTKTAVTGAMVPAYCAANTGFYSVDTTVNVPGAAVATTGINGALPPVVTTGSTAGLSNGSVVRLYAPAGALQVGGMDFTIGSVIANTSFTLAHMPAIVAATPAAGAYRMIPYNPYFYPRNRYITKITAAANALVTLSVDHQFTVGQKIRFIIPAVSALAYGMTELNGVEATIIAINATDGTSTNTITVNVDTSAMTAFALPLTTDSLLSYAQVVPVGSDTASCSALGTDTLGDATRNTGVVGMQLVAGTASPAGAANDIIYWVAGKSFNQ